MKLSLYQIFLLGVLISCASQPEEKKKDDKTQEASKDSTPTKKMTTGPTKTVITTLQNDLTFMFFLPPDIAAKTQDSLGLKKEVENVPLSVTYLSASRLSRQPIDQKTFQKIALAGGSQSPWFLLEYAYTAILKKDFLLADYIIGKAKKNAKDENAQNACSHALGLKLISEGETYLGVIELQRAKSYFPSLLTLGFMAVRSGDGASGERYLRTALSQGENLLVRVGLASALRLQGKATEAQETLTPVYKAKEKDKRVVWNYGLILSQNSATSAEAKTTLEKYYSLSGSTPELDSYVQKTLNQLKTPPKLPEVKSTDTPPGAAVKIDPKTTPNKLDSKDPVKPISSSTPDPKSVDSAKTDNKESNKNPTSSPGVKPDTLKTESKSDKPSSVKEADSKS
jgi:hypothetical protein